MEYMLEQLKEKNILITGACGLIGSAIVDYCMMLNNEYSYDIKVTAMSRDKIVASKRFQGYINNENFEILVGDVCKPLPYQREWDYIIHAASNAHPIAFAKEPVETMKANLIGTINILDHMVNQKNRGGEGQVVYISTGEVYGEAIAGKDGFAENQIGLVDSMLVRSCYPESKRAAETLCVSYANEYQVQVKIARLGYVYGPNFNIKNSRADVQFFLKAVHKENIVLKSNGSQIRSYCYISDAIKGIFYILLKGKNADAYNIANKENICSIRQFAEMIAKVSGVLVEFDIPEEVEKSGYSKMKQEILSTDKLEALGWSAEVDIEEGIRKVVCSFASDE